MSANSFVTCEDCDQDFVLGRLPQKQRCSLYAQKFSQVKAILYAHELPSFEFDWTNLASWTAFINNNSMTSSFGRYIGGIGEIGEPDTNEVEYVDRQQKTDEYIYTLSHKVVYMSDQQYDMLRLLQCGNTNFRFWWVSIDDTVYGGPEGISPDLIRATMPKGGDRNAREFATISIRFCTDADPDRVTIPGLSDAIEQSSLEMQVFGYPEIATGSGTAFGYPELTSGSGTIFGVEARSQGSGLFPELPSGVWFDLNTEDTARLRFDSDGRITKITDAQGGTREMLLINSSNPVEYINDPAYGLVYRNLNGFGFRIVDFPFDYNPGYTIFVVGIPLFTSVPDGILYIYSATPSTTQNYIRKDSSGDTQPNRVRGKHGGNARGLSTMTVDPFLAAIRLGNIDSKVRYNGTEDNSSMGEFQYGNKEVTIGQFVGGVSSMNGYIKRVIMWDRQLTNQEFSQVVNTLSAQYPWIVNP